MAEMPQTVEVNVVMGAQLRAIVRSALLHVKNRVKEQSIHSPVVSTIIDQEMQKWPLSLEGDNDDTLPQWLYNRFGKLMEPLDPTETAKDWDELDENAQSYWEHEAAAVRRAVGRGGFRTSPEQIGINTIDELNKASARADADGGQVKGYVQLNLKDTESLGEAIRICMGAASTCWTDVFHAGTFQPEIALDIATQLEHHVMAKITEGLGLIGQRHQALAERLRSYRNAGHPTVSIQQAYSILAGTSTPEEYASALQPRPGNAAELGRPTNG